LNHVIAAAPTVRELESMVDFAEDNLDPETAPSYTKVKWLAPKVGMQSASDHRSTAMCLPPAEALDGATTCFRQAEAACCCVSVVGCCYLVGKYNIIDSTEYGIAVDWWGNARRLDPGMHFISSINCSVDKFQQMENHVHYGNLHLIRIPPKNIGIGVFGNEHDMSGFPVLLAPGIHEIRNAQFQLVHGSISFGDSSSTNIIQRPGQQESSPYWSGDAARATGLHYQAGPLNLIFVPTGMIALCEIEGVGHFLAHKDPSIEAAAQRGQNVNAQGAHIINTRPFILKAVASLTCEHLNAGTKHRILVPSGRIGIYEENGVPGFLQAGRPFYYDSPTFKYHKSYDLTEPRIEYNSLKIITVKEGHVGIVYDEGCCLAYKKGWHVFDKPTQKFAGFISLGMETFVIPPVTTVSADNVELSFVAAITIEISDPATACKWLMSASSNSRATQDEQEFGQGLIHENVANLARLHLASIVGHHSYNMAFKATQIVEGDSNSRAPPTDFKGVLCAEFLQGAAAKDAEGRAHRKAEEIEAAKQALPLASDKAAAEQALLRLQTQYKKCHKDAQRLAEPTGSKSFVTEMWEKGIKVTKFSIEDIRIMDPSLATAMGKAALLDLDQAKARTDANAAVARADGEAKVKRREAEGAAQAKGILVDAEYKTKVKSAEADHKEIQILSDAMRRAGSFSKMWGEWKLTRGAGEALSQTKSAVVMAPSMGELSGLLCSPPNDGKKGKL